MRALYVDDSAADRELVRYTLTEGGTRVELTEAESFAEAGAAMKPGAFDVVLSDYHLLGHDATDVIRMVHSRDPGLPVIIVTGTGSEETAVAAMRNGAADYVIKTLSHLRRLPLAIDVAVKRKALAVDYERTQGDLERALRVCRMKVECNEVLVHATSEAGLMARMCKTLVDAGGFRTAWVALADPGAPGRLSIHAHAGLAGDGGTFEVADSHCPAKVAIRTGLPQVTRRAACDKAVACGRNCHLERGAQSVVSLPLMDQGVALGVLTVYEAAADAFDDAHIDMFQHLANDIAYGVLNLRAQAAGRAEHAARLEAERRLTSILANIDHAVWSADRRGLIYMSPAAERVFGRPVSDFFSDRCLWRTITHPEDRPLLHDTLRRGRVDDALRVEYRIVLPDASVRWVESRFHAVRDDKGCWIRVDGVTADITSRRRDESRIEYLATHDALTGVANRNLLGDRFEQAAAQVRRSGAGMAIMVLDVDRFKNVNDSYGHGLGDELLRGIARRLSAAIRPGDTLARLGGDDFVILVAECPGAETIARQAESIRDALNEPLTIDGREFHVAGSIGISVFPADGEDLGTLMKNADVAMYRAKSAGGDAFQFYSHEMSTRAVERIELEHALRRALERDELLLYYQPKVDLSSGRIVGVEALVRWQRPGVGMVPPSRFIPVAEDTGLIVPLGEWVLRTACNQTKAWQASGLPAVPVSVNVSARQFHQENLVTLVESALLQADLAPRWLELELTESMAMHDGEMFVSRLHMLKALGVRLALDDFGTGYSSLGYLKRFPIDRLKIDQSFVRELATDRDEGAVTRTVIALGHSLHMKVIAEGVETPAQLRFLRDHGCDEVQGYLFSKPLAPDALATLLARGASWEAEGRPTAGAQGVDNGSRAAPPRDLVEGASARCEDHRTRDHGNNLQGFRASTSPTRIANRIRAARSATPSLLIRRLR